MNGRLIWACIIGATVGIITMPATATTCYEVIDRNNVVTFRGLSSPVDLSDRGAAARDAMRNRGDLLVIYEAPSCIAIEVAGPTGTKTPTTEEIVSGWRSFGNSGFGGSYGSSIAARGSGGIAAPTPTNTGPTPAAQEAAAIRGLGLRAR